MQGFYGRHNPDRIQAHTSETANQKIFENTQNEIRQLADKSPEELTQKIYSLQREWDIERWFDVAASIICFIGVCLGFFVDIYWLILPMFILILLLQHALQGWSLSLPLFRWIRIRSQKEIDQEIYALKALRGDFEGISGERDPDFRAKQAFSAVTR